MAEEEHIRRELEGGQIFADLATAKAVVLAVSGGPDSVALMRLAADWAKTGSAPPFFVATVDHGLRPESAKEAHEVGVWARALGLPHKTLVWAGPKPKTRLQERAREARYALLCDYAKEIGADFLVTAHHADDQAETILFRLLRGSGIAGLAGMPRVARRGALTLVRPLLDYPKDALIALCDERGQTFFRDPSNEDVIFARARLRQLLPRLAQEGLDRDALLRLGRRAARVDLALDSYAEKARATLSATRANGRFSAPVGGLADEPLETFIRVIAMEIEALQPARPLRFDRLESLSAALQNALKTRDSWRGTLAGMSFELSRDGSLTIAPEKRRQRGSPGPHETENSPSRDAMTSPCHDPVTSG